MIINYADTITVGEKIEIYGKVKNRMGGIEWQRIKARDSGKRRKMNKHRH